MYKANKTTSKISLSQTSNLMAISLLEQYGNPDPTEQQIQLAEKAILRLLNNPGLKTKDH